MWCAVPTDNEQFTVAKVQVGLLGVGEELRQDLNTLAAKADTSTTSGLHMLMQGVHGSLLLLLQPLLAHQRCCSKFAACCCCCR